MSQYLNIPSPTGGSCNSNLREVIIYIGKHYGKLAGKKGRPDEYFKSGIKFISKHFGSFKKTAIRLMVEPKRIKNSRNKRWCYNKRIYGKAYEYIIYLLRKRRPIDEVYITKLFENLYQNICKVVGTGSNLNYLCSDALLYWQKGMLRLHEINAHVSSDDIVIAGKILSKIDEVDKSGKILMKTTMSGV